MDGSLYFEKLLFVLNPSSPSLIKTTYTESCLNPLFFRIRKGRGYKTNFANFRLIPLYGLLVLSYL